MDGAHSTQEIDEKYLQNFILENLEGRGHLGDKDTDGRIILKWILSKREFRNIIKMLWERKIK
jgi:hypothetical protein